MLVLMCVMWRSPNLFYRDIIRLQELDRPDFDFAGAWFAVGDTGQQLHLIRHDGETLRQGPINTRDGHFAIRVRSYRETLDWLRQCGLEPDARPHARLDSRRFTCWTPTITSSNLTQRCWTRSKEVRRRHAGSGQP